MQLILPLVYTLLFILLICKVRFFDMKGISKRSLALLFILKLIAGVVVFLVYTKYYTTSDFQVYFSDSKILFDHFFGNTNQLHMQRWNADFENVLFNSSRTMIVLNAILQIFSFGNFYVHIVFFCFFSFIGLTAFYKSFINHFPDKKKQLIISIFLIPTVLFWSSAVLKESLVILLVGLLIYISDFGLKKTYSLSEKISILVLLLLLIIVKMYVAIALIPVLSANVVIAKMSSKYILLKYISIIGLIFFASFVVKSIHPNYNVLQLMSDKQAKSISEAQGGVFLVSDKNFICVDYNQRENILILQPDSTYRIKNGSTFLSWKLDNMKDTAFITNANDSNVYKQLYSVKPANTVITLKRLKPDLLSFIVFAPQAVMNVLIQPTLFNINSWLHLIIAIENIWMILILILAIFFFDKEVIKNKEVVIFCFIFSIILFVLIGITTPVVGSMVRYRTIGLLFFVPVIFMLIDEKKIKRRLKLKK